VGGVVTVVWRLAMVLLTVVLLPVVLLGLVLKPMMVAMLVGMIRQVVLLGVLLGVLLVVNASWLQSIDRFLLKNSDLIDQIFDRLLEALEELSQVWEHELERIDVLVLVVLDGILDLSVEGVLLDVLSLDRLVPLVVEAGDGGGQLTHVVRESVDLGHLLQVRVAGIVDIGKLVEVKELSENVENVVEEASLHVLHEDTLAWVLKAPSLGIVTNSFEVADLGVLVEHIDKVGANILDLVDSN